MPASRGLVATVVCAAVGSLLVACSSDPPSAPRVSVSTPASPAAPSGAPSPQDWTPIPLTNDDSLPGGRMGMTANGRPDAPWAVLDVPPGFETIGGWVIFDPRPEAGGGVGYWTISEVVRDPCGDPEPMPAGSSVAEVVAAFGQQRLTRVSKAVAVTVDGNDGLSIDLAVPDDVDFAVCPHFSLWESDPAGSRYMQSPGEFDRLWILDVDGEVVVLTVTADDRIPRSAIAGLTEMVESAQFVPRAP